MSVYASKLLKNFYATEAMRDLFSDEARIANFLKVEVALAKVEAALGIIPPEAFEDIARGATVLEIDWERLRRDIETVGYPVQPFLNQFAEACGGSGEYLHWGSTTRDVTDTSLVLQMREALDVIRKDAVRVRTALLELTARHRDTLMIARTHGMHALPSTFGFRCAVWLAELDRQLDRLGRVRRGLVAGQFGGAVGTLAALGEQGLEVQAALMKELGLEPPPISWFASRDNIAEVVFTLSSLASTMASIAKTLVVMTRDEVGEVREPGPPGRGTSSAMPHKHNTVGSELVLVHARMAAQHVAIVMESMVQDYERDWQGHFETIVVPQTFMLAHAAVLQMAHVLEGLEVLPARMRQNLEVTGGLVMAESVMMKLADKIGRKTAHRLVSRACEQANAESRHLREVLVNDPAVTERMSIDEIAAAMDPRNYIGTALASIDRVLAAARGKGSWVSAKTAEHRQLG